MNGEKRQEIIALLDEVDGMLNKYHQLSLEEKLNTTLIVDTTEGLRAARTLLNKLPEGKEYDLRARYRVLVNNYEGANDDWMSINETEHST